MDASLGMLNAEPALRKPEAQAQFTVKPDKILCCTITIMEEESLILESD